MPRHRMCRRVAAIPTTTGFEPRGASPGDAAAVVLPVEGLEALRLADLEGLAADAAARLMGVSRHTFGRVLTEARSTVAQALVGGLSLRIEGGDYRLAGDGPAAPEPDGQPCDAPSGSVPASEAHKEQAMRGRGNCGRGGQGRGMGQGQCPGQGRGGAGRGRGQGQGQGQGMGQGTGQGMGQGRGLPQGVASPQAMNPVAQCPTCGRTLAAAPAGAEPTCPDCGVVVATQER
ncbi:MAG: DUF134 domain-containing protein [Acidobacteriota bacterium]